MIRVVVWIVTGLILFNSQAFALSNNYYSQDLLNSETQADSAMFRKVLHQNLAQFHIKQANYKPDVIMKQCPKNTKCTKHEKLHYSEARIELLGNIHLEEDSSGYFIQTLYCQKKLSKKDFGKGRGPAPGRVPDHRVLNTEHIWPQSRFSKKFSKSLQKADMHALYPATSISNGTRGNLPFAEVSSVTKDVCKDTQLGTTDADSRIYLQPPAQFRGDIARALFYFSVRYNIPIDPVQEEFFRKWHLDDPVSDSENTKNDMVYDAQKNRNPFVDNPEWADLITDF